MTYEGCFREMTGGLRPFEWQDELGRDNRISNRMIRVPTGFGKTCGVLGAWLYNRVVLGNTDWPRRLVWCLPMRTLAEQTVDEATRLVQSLGTDWDGNGDHAEKVGVHLLMGGSDAGDWALHPEEDAILVGTQDMLLSRSLNRGYASSRARWPMEFGMLNHDCLWIMDEVQLMDAGLATSAQLQAFREQDDAEGKLLRPCKTWWMSATLQPGWLGSPDTGAMLRSLSAPLSVPLDSLSSGVGGNPKTLTVHAVTDDASIAAAVREGHRAGELTLVVMNRVKDAVAVAALLRRDGSCDAEIRLVHSRYRPQERKAWRDVFLHRAASIPAHGRIIVATQVVEAGVDISAGLLVTDLAPWPSLVQRLGRCARYDGQQGRVIVLDRGLCEDDDKRALPYPAHELVAARDALNRLPGGDAGVFHLETLESRMTAGERDRLYPYQPAHLLQRREIEDLFDTTPDLTGADLDISRFIRSGEERDLFVFWRDVPQTGSPGEDMPLRDELCPVSIFDARKWMFSSGKSLRSWVWDYLDARWRRCRGDDVYPGQTVLVARDEGGYSVGTGWTGAGSDIPDVMPPAVVTEASQRADMAQEHEDLSQAAWKTIALHGHETACIAQELSLSFDLPGDLLHVLTLVGRWHDTGKTHPAFQNSIRRDSRGNPGRQDIAKAPPSSWESGLSLYRMEDGRRRGFRHEVASAMAILSVLERHAPMHGALLGPCRDLIGLPGAEPQASPPRGEDPSPAEREVMDLDANSFNLLLYLTCAHHGKVRMAWHATPHDQEYQDHDGKGLPIRGIRNGDRLPPLSVQDSGGTQCVLPETELALTPAAMGFSPRTGPSWNERSLTVLSRHGPFALAWLEALARVCDIRASRLRTMDPDLFLDEPDSEGASS